MEILIKPLKYFLNSKCLKSLQRADNTNNSLTKGFTFAKPQLCSQVSAPELA